MNQSTDSGSSDSDDGVRFKTATTREVIENRSRRSKYSHKSDKSYAECRRTKSRSPIEEKREEDNLGTIYGPSLPAHLLNKSNSLICGPVLPPHLIQKQEIAATSSNDTKQCIGPMIPQEFRTFVANYNENSEKESTDDDCYGPLPLEMQRKTPAHVALEERAMQIKLDKLNPQSTIESSREEWMLELPAVHAANLGLGPRQFRSKEGPNFSDRSSWTDTPNKNKSKKVDKAETMKTAAELQMIREHDDEQEKLAQKQRKREKSLLEQHQAAKKRDDKNERRPFNRDTDLKVNRFDDAQKKAIMKKAQLLDDRFSQGQSKFL